VLVRAVLQFHRFARFAPDAPRLSDEEYKRLILAVCRIPVWMPDRADSDRHRDPPATGHERFLKGREHAMKECIGNWFPTYLRVGNWRMIGPVPPFRAGQCLLRNWCAGWTGENCRPVPHAFSRKMNHLRDSVRLPCAWMAGRRTPIRRL